MSDGSGWTQMLFKDACEFTSKPRGLKMLDFEQIPFVPMELIPERALSSNKYILKDSSLIGSGTYFEPGDILLAKITPCFENGKQTIVAELPLSFGFATTEVIPLRERPGISDKDYLFFYLLRPDVRGELASRMEGSTGRQRLNKASLENLPLALPPIDEQRAIAHVLRTAQEARETRQRELALERERKAALMEHLFTHGTHGERSKKTEIGEIPESWELTSLGSLCEDGLGIIQTGPFGSQLHASDYVRAGVPVVNPTHLGFNSIETERLPHIVKEFADSLSKHYLLEGDILISRRGDFSRFAHINPGEAGWLCGTGCMLVRLANPAIDNYFLALSISLDSIQTYLKQAAVGSIMPNLNTTILSQMPVIIPAIDEQHRIAEILRACESKIRALEREIPLIEELFGVMQEELMTGRLATSPFVKAQQAQ